MAHTLIHVAHHQRHPRSGAHSLERVFAAVRANLPEDVEAFRSISPYPSAGVAPRVRGMLAATRVRADVHHVVGDTHYLAIALPGPQTVLTVHDCTSMHRLRGIRRAAFKLFWYTLPLARAAAVTTISEFSRRELLELTRCAPGKLSVIHNPLPGGFSVAVQRPVSGVPRVLCVGTSPNKNIERIAAALEGVPCEVHLVGEPTAAQREAFGRHRVTLVSYGQIADGDLPSVYAQTDLLLFPSTYEGFGLPIIEAQAVGRPVVTSSTCSMPEVAGPGAVLVDPLNSEDIGAAVRRLLSDAALQGRLVELGHENVKRFDPAVIGRAYASLYRRVAAAHQVRPVSPREPRHA